LKSNERAPVLPRLIAIEESFPDGLPPDVCASEYRRFTAVLENEQPVTVVEHAIQLDRVYDIAHSLALSIRRRRYYAHVVLSADHLIVIFPSCVVDLHRGIAEEREVAHMLGHRLGVPASEMRFDEMFDVDHPDLEVS